MLDPTRPSTFEAELTQLSELGYVILHGVLATAEIDALKQALAPLERERPMGRNSFEGSRTQRVYSLASKGPVFMRLAEHPRVMAIADAVLLPNFLLSTLQSIRLHAEEPGQPWHADDMFYQIARPHPTLALSAIWAVEDFTEDNGATSLIPGSHRWGPEHPDERPHTEISAVMKAGSVVVFDGSLWHRGGANRATGTRLAISPQYCQPWLRPQESQLLICPPSLAAGQSARGRSMLGYSIHPPFIGQVEGMHPLRLIDGDYGSQGRDQKTVAGELADRYLDHPT
jgi:ectoine hydroxylase-related dioxygenase (phytanoyl-CoA dioxygenase family)